MSYNLLKISWIIVAVLLYCSIGLTAQQRQLDSLINLEQHYLQNDTIKVKLFNDIARTFYTSNPNKGIEYAERAIELSQKLDNSKYLAMAYSAKGTNKMALSDYTAALENYQNALSINEKINNKQGIASNFNNIGLVYYSIFDYPKALEFYQKTLILHENTGNKTGQANSFGNIGNIYNDLHDYPKAIEFYQKSLEISEKSSNNANIAGILVNLGNVYTQLGNYPKALEYKQKALTLNEKIGNKGRIANNLSNLGNVYTQLGEYEKALIFHQKALIINENLQDKKGIATNYSGISLVYSQEKNTILAKQYAQKARDLAHRISHWSTESEALLQLSKIYETSNQMDSAYFAYQQYIVLRDTIDNVEKQKQITKKTLQFEFNKKEEHLQQQQQLTDAKLQQQTLLATQRQQELLIKQTAIDLSNKQKELQHLAYLKTQADLQAEQSQRKEKEKQLTIVEQEQQLQRTQMNLQQTELSLKDSDLQSQKTQRLFYIAGLALLALLSFFIFRNFRLQQKSNALIHSEKKKSDALLLNILPSKVAEELKINGETTAQQYDNVTVLFTDFVGFTQIAEQLSPQELVTTLHNCFKAFDEIMEKYGIEKIKTIGDAYMAVSGLPTANAKHAQNAVQAALEILAFIECQQRSNAPSFFIRIGLHTGSVVAGVVGVKKFAYDIWGDTVNTAARMESSGEAGKVNISESTYNLVQTDFTCTPRGKIKAKNKGAIEMYFVEK
ncbi:MAG: hypothetical protein RLZZ292_249 [Bacteroidota bacterium]|jgi:class 3 adenylate cyclase/tetratricopeptide (TPR) repeat protein